MVTTGDVDLGNVLDTVRVVSVAITVLVVCWIGVAVPIGIDEFCIATSGRYGATTDVGHDGGDGILAFDPIIPFANFSKLRKFSVSFDSIDKP